MGKCVTYLCWLFFLKPPLLLSPVNQNRFNLWADDPTPEMLQKFKVYCRVSSKYQLSIWAHVEIYEVSWVVGKAFPTGRKTYKKTRKRIFEDISQIHCCDSWWSRIICSKLWHKFSYACPSLGFPEHPEIWSAKSSVKLGTEMWHWMLDEWSQCQWISASDGPHCWESYPGRKNLVLSSCSKCLTVIAIKLMILSCTSCFSAE